MRYSFSRSLVRSGFQRIESIEQDGPNKLVALLVPKGDIEKVLHCPGLEFGPARNASANNLSVIATSHSSFKRIISDSTLRLSESALPQPCHAHECVVSRFHDKVLMT